MAQDAGCMRMCLANYPLGVSAWLAVAQRGRRLLTRAIPRGVFLIAAPGDRGRRGVFLHTDSKSAEPGADRNAHVGCRHCGGLGHGIFCEYSDAHGGFMELKTCVHKFS